MVHRRLIAGLLTLSPALLVLACGPDNSRPGTFPAYAAAERLPLDVCDIEGADEPLLCGVFEVFEDRSAASGRTVPIRVVVIPAQEEGATDSAWIEHQGGPRYSMVASAPSFALGGVLESFRRKRDVVLVDPRGLHESGPLYCEALSHPRILERYYPPERVAACRAELESKATLEHYSTLNAIDDYEDIRRWLGYEQWDVGGWSFGARFMLTYLHRYPDAIRSVVLFAPAILNFERPLDYARFGQQALDALLADCQADDDCRRAFPDALGDLERAFATLELEPVSHSFADPDTGALVSRQLTRDLFAEHLWTALLYSPSARQIPYLVNRAADGDFQDFFELVVPSEPQEPEPEGHYFSVVCPEETNRLTLERAAAAALGTFIGSYTANDYIGACEAWGLPDHPDHPMQARKFDVPALIITGAQDPVTAPEYGEINKQHFLQALHVTVPRMAHGTAGLKNVECFTQVLSDFVDRASTESLDLSCIDKVEPPPFRLE